MSFIYNPFSGVDIEDTPHIIAPQFNLSDISSHHSIIQLVGKRGRGKTTHLQWISNSMSLPYFRVEHSKDIRNILNSDSTVVCIDELDKLNIISRRQLFLSTKRLIVATHYSKWIEALLYRKNLQTIRIKGINTSILDKLIQKRLHHTDTTDNKKTQLNYTIDSTKLIQTHNDNYRKIITSLYRQYNEYN